ncbi:multidrug effflux MFS transporter [Marinobacter sp. X15-166B]|uniref:multidrug effflux MFS transporter n=1 Tax=Marinobacter sp. X15-166B TaxID=1897620 RepID=UPI00085C585F|nr:multidrug effflux MFS transporter [Marinobacter sp. X15-166B]OEY65571.1 MFS transporter [Marinobacter sp. X15-166B]
MSQLQLAILLGMTVALGPLTLDAYLPAFPQIATDLDVSHADVGLTLSIYVAALGLGQLVGGPLSDRYGRQAILLGGLLVFAAAAVMVAQSGSINEMLGWRLIQGVGGAFCAVSVPAIVRDQFQGTEAARLFGLIGLIMFVAPAAAPSLGALLLLLSDWPAIFLMLAGYAVFLGGVLRLRLFRRLPPKERVQTPVSTLVTNYGLVLRHWVTMRFIGLQALCFSTMLVFITHSSFIYQEWFGLSSGMFSALFAANIVAMACLNIFNRYLLTRFEAVAILRVSVVLQFSATLVLVACAWAGASYWVIAACMIAVAGFMGSIIPNNMANALEFFPKLGGTTAALLGATQFTVAGGISAVSTVIGEGSLLAIVLVMAVCSLGATLLAVGAPKAVRREEARIEKEVLAGNS